MLNRVIATVLLMLLTVLIIFQVPGIAQTSATNLSSRLSRLELDLSTLSSRVRRLETSLGRVDSSAPSTVPAPSYDAVPESVLANDPMFERLATLVIELKERIDSLEERIVRLEAE